MNQQVRVVITDDQPPTRQGLKALLAHYPQIKVVGEAANGQEAVQLMAACWPDVVLMDMQMPVMDGVNATRWIKLQWPHIRVVALSMYGRYEADAFNAGVDDFLIKGCAAETLIDAILQFRKFCAGDV